MKHSTLFIYLALVFFFFACKKDGTTSFPSNATFIDSAVTFLKSSLSNDDFAKLDVASGVPLVYRKENIGFKVSEKNSTPDNFIILYKKHGAFAGNRISIINKKSLVSKDHNGAISVEALDKKSTVEFIIKNNKVIQTIRSNDASLINNNFNNTFLAKKEATYVLPEVVVISYGNSNPFYWSWYCLSCGNDGSEWLYTSGFDGDYVSGGNNSGSQQPVDNVYSLPKFISPKTPIVDVKEELKCFTVNAASSYSVSVNVNQPSPGSRDKVDFSADFMVGHSFLTLQQTNSDGSQITRTVGFYPKNSAMPGSSVDVSTFGDDTNTPYTVSLKISVSAAELATVANTLVSQQSQNFDLDNFNCTNSVISALSSINVNLPSTSSSNTPIFSGNNPADLGQDIRAMDINDFSSENGNRQIIRTQSDIDNLKPASKSGTC